MRHLITIILCALFAIACGSKDEPSADPAAEGAEGAEGADEADEVAGGEEATDDAGADEAEEAVAEEVPTEQDFEEEAIADIDAKALKKAVDELEKEIGEE